MRKLQFAGSLIALCAATLAAQSTTAPAARPAAARNAASAPAMRAGFSVDRLARVDALLERYVDENQIAGAVALVLRNGQPVYEKAVGWADKEANRRMTSDTIFRIASQSKAITSVGVLTLVEEGRIAITDPVAKFIPAYAKTTVAAGGSTFRPSGRSPSRTCSRTPPASLTARSRKSRLYEAKGLGPAAGFGRYTADKDE